MIENANTKTQLLSIGCRVKEARQDMGLTQEQFADKFGYARVTLAKLEAGIRDFKSTEIITLAEQLNVSCDYLLGKTDVKSPDTNIQAISDYTGLSKEAIEILNDIQQGTKGRHFTKISDMHAYIIENNHDSLYEYKILLYVINLLLSKEKEMKLFELIKNYLTHEYTNINTESVLIDEKSEEHLDTHIRLKDKKTEKIWSISVDTIQNILLIEIQKKLVKLKEEIYKRGR